MVEIKIKREAYLKRLAELREKERAATDAAELKKIADQKKFIGNAVEVTIARAWCEALCMKLSMNIKDIA